jgi:hypothetical protein
MQPSIRVVLTSGYDAELAAEQDTAGGRGLKVLRKPYKQADLAHALAEALNGQTQPPAGSRDRR